MPLIYAWAGGGRDTVSKLPWASSNSSVPSDVIVAGDADEMSKNVRGFVKRVTEQCIHDVHLTHFCWGTCLKIDVIITIGRHGMNAKIKFISWERSINS